MLQNTVILRRKSFYCGEKVPLPVHIQATVIFLAENHQKNLPHNVTTGMVKILISGFKLTHRAIFISVKL